MHHNNPTQSVEAIFYSCVLFCEHGILQRIAADGTEIGIDLRGSIDFDVVPNEHSVAVGPIHVGTAGSAVLQIRRRKIENPVIDGIGPGDDAAIAGAQGTLGSWYMSSPL